MRLGDGFYIPVVEEPVEVVRQPSFEDLRNEQLLVAISALQDALVNLPRPEVHVEAPDLTAIVQAVTGLKPGATSEDIAQAVVREISPTTSQTDTAEVLGKLVKALEKLDFRMQATSGGGGVAVASSRVTNVDGTSLDTQPVLLDSRYEWQQSGAQSVPLYIGTALPKTATSAASWRIEKYTYISGPAGDPVPSVVQAATGAWDSRASLF